jgi:hypothetical protein
MANNINWGKIYCDMTDNLTWGLKSYTTFYSVPDYSAPTCYGDTLAADTNLYKADTTTFTADATIT